MNAGERPARRLDFFFIIGQGEIVVRGEVKQLVGVREEHLAAVLAGSVSVRVQWPARPTMRILVQRR